MNKFAQRISAYLIALWSLCFWGISNATASECLNGYKPAPKKLEKFIERHIGRQNLFSINYKYLGLTSRNCPHYDGSKCKPKSWGNYGRNLFHYPKIDGLYSILPSEYGEIFSIGKVLDGHYFLEDVKRAIEDQLGLKPDENAMFQPDDPFYYYIGNGGRMKLKIFDTYISMSININFPRERRANSSRTVIEYQIKHERYSVTSCIKREESNKRAKDKGKSLKLD